MKNHFFSFLVLLSFVFSASAQTVKLSDAEKNLRATVAYLASDTLEGRRTGEAGATSAAGYVANMFAQYKLTGILQTSEKGKTSRNFLQPFPYVSGVALGQDNLLRIVPENPQNESKMEAGINWMPIGYSPNADIAGAPIVFAGFGVVAGERNYDDYAGVDARGKIVLVLDGTPDGVNPNSSFARFNLYAKAKIAQEKGARALLIIARESDFKNDRLAQLKFDQTLGETVIPVAAIMRSHGAQLLGVDSEKQLDEIEKWLAMRKDAPANIQIKLAAEMRATAQMRVNLTKKQTEAYNVIGILEGTDAVLKNEIIVIGAHYDHLGKGGAGSLAVNSTEIHHGADDNASGVAAVLELARQFAKEKKNKRTIVFMAFGGEEEGLLGSKFYVNNPVFPLDKTVAMINLDMVGRLNENKLTVGGIGTASEWRDLLSVKNNIEVPVVKEIIPAFALQFNEDGFGPSDHSSFYAKQIPVLFFFTGTHADYHKPSDTAEKINYEGLLKVTNYVSEIAKTIDRNPKRPTYAVAKSSGTGGRTGFNVTIGVVPSYAESTDGLRLDGVRDGSPAALAGIKAGDKIVKFAGKEIRNISDYTFVLGELKADTEYEIEVVRGAERLTLKVKPAARK
jgi:aminopeptidase YwaD